MTNWPKIHLLEGRLKWHRGKAHYAQDRLSHWKEVGNAAHRHNSIKGITEARAEIRKWKGILEPELREIHKLESALNSLRPKGVMYHLGGWVAPGEPWRMQRQDQGQDFEILRYHHVVAPGHGHCIGWGSDRPFPNGFGNPYALVKITSGRFAGNDWYIGHANEPIIRPGQSFTLGQPLARANNSLNSGWGWIELGHLPYGGMSEGSNWHHLFTDVLL